MGMPVISESGAKYQTDPGGGEEGLNAGKLSRKLRHCYVSDHLSSSTSETCQLRTHLAGGWLLQMVLCFGLGSDEGAIAVAPASGSIPLATPKIY